MKKQKKVQAKKKKTTQPQPAQSAPVTDRRKTLKLFRNGIIGAGLLAGGGFFAVGSVRKTMAEFDLSRIGQGAPSVVQIHDPNCSLCQVLQKQTRRALRAFEEDEITFLVANITTPEGQNLATIHGVGHVTLLLFDEAGQRIAVSQGVQSKQDLETLFRAEFGL